MRFAITLLTILSMATAAHAQEGELTYSAPKTPSTLGIVPMIGLGFSHLQWEGGNTSVVRDHNYPNFGFNAGLLKEFGTSGTRFQTGLLYLRETGTVKFEFESGNYRSTSQSDFTVEHIGIPLLVRFRGAKMNGGFAAFRAGVIPAYATGSSTKNTWSSSYKDTSSSGSRDEWSKDGLRSVNVFGLIGLGLETTTAIGREIRFELSYNRSLLPLNHDANEAQVFTQSYLLNIGTVL